MANKNILVTGGSGFIGKHLVKRLIARGDNVTCLVRRTSNIEELKPDCRIVYGDTIKDPASVSAATKGMDAVFHLAASTHAIRAKELVEINSSGFRNVVQACADSQSPPTLLFVSSLAAAGPSIGKRLQLESDPRNPVSFYGRSKAKCESIAAEFSSQVPTSIVRPPIVLGGGDRTGLDMFRPIDRWGVHFTPGFTKRYFSVIHADDLANALISVYDSGLRLSNDSNSQGIYFASADETFSYSELGQLIGKALGRRHTRVIRVGKPCFWLVSAINELAGRLTSNPKYLSLDKFHEAFAGSWACSNAKIKKETGFVQAATMLERLKQTCNWYRENGWLARKDGEKSSRRPPHMSPTT